LKLPQFVSFACGLDVVLSKTRPSAINLPSGGTGSAMYVAGEIFGRQANITWLHIPYKSGSEALTAVLSGETSVFFSPFATVLPHINSQRSRGLAVSSAARLVAKHRRMWLRHCERGLLVESPLGDLHVPSPRVTDNLASLAPVDLVLFAVKLWDTETAARAIVPLVGPATTVISFQNGVQKDEVLCRILGDHAVTDGACYIAATIAGPGVIRHAGAMQKLIVGEYDGALSPRDEAFRHSPHQ
jgi:ketopantoate reductase PanE/ApbA-like protein/tripartite tricarboxylate transporter family receptor